MPPEARPPVASIVIPCWNGLKDTRACVESVLRGTRKPPFELIFIDNASTDGTPRYLASLDARVIRNRRNLGFARAINQGMRAARGEFVVWLNNDAVVTPGWLERLVACARRSPKVGAVGPLTNADLPKTGRREPADRLSAALSLRRPGAARPIHWLLGFCLLVRREAIERIGLLDERFGPGLYEDYDYCLRLRQAGYEIMLAEDAFVAHRWHGALDRKDRLAQVRKNRELFIDKWCRASLAFLDTLGEKAQTPQFLG